MSLLPGRKRADFKQERAANDWYWEPSECIRTSFRTVQVEGTIHDPACGSGRIPTVAREFGYKETGSDLVDRGYGFPHGVNFLEDNTLRDTVICNPPSRLTEEVSSSPF